MSKIKEEKMTEEEIKEEKIKEEEIKEEIVEYYEEVDMFENDKQTKEECKEEIKEEMQGDNIDTAIITRTLGLVGKYKLFVVNS